MLIVFMLLLLFSYVVYSMLSVRLIYLLFFSEKLAHVVVKNSFYIEKAIFQLKTNVFITGARPSPRR